MEGRASRMAFNLISDPSQLFIETEAGWSNADHIGLGQWSSHSMEIATVGEKGELKLTIREAKVPVKTLKLRWTIRVEERISILGDHWERAYGDLEWRGIVPERVMPWYFLTNDGNITAGYGVKTGPSAFCYWQLDAEGITLTTDVRNGNLGVILGARQLEVATVIVYEGQEGESAFVVATKFCSLMCEKPLLPLQPVYGGTNWYYTYGKIYSEEVLRDSRFISSLSSNPHNRPFMVVDCGWQLGSEEGAITGGPWMRGNARFPDMEGLASSMKTIGVRPGIWCRPLLVSEAVPKDWLRYEVSGEGVLDPSVPDALHYIEESIRRMAGWGYELIKHDFTNYELFGEWGYRMKSNTNVLSQPFKDRSKTSAEIVLDLYRAIAEASGDSLIMGINTISHLAAGLTEIMRTGDDTSGRSWERTRYMGVNTLAFRMPQHRTFYSHDADVVGITGQIPWELNKQWMALLAESGSTFFVSVDPSLVTKDQEATIRLAFERSSEPQPAGEPLDWMTNTCPSRWKLNGKETTFKWNEPSLATLSTNDNEWWK